MFGPYHGVRSVIRLVRFKCCCVSAYPYISRHTS